MRVLDVREESEFRGGHLPGAIHVPVKRLPDRVGRLKRDKPYAVICASGSRSRGATSYLLDQGFEGTVSVRGGRARGRAAVVPSCGERLSQCPRRERPLTRTGLPAAGALVAGGGFRDLCDPHYPRLGALEPPRSSRAASSGAEGGNAAKLTAAGGRTSRAAARSAGISNRSAKSRTLLRSVGLRPLDRSETRGGHAPLGDQPLHARLVGRGPDTAGLAGRRSRACRDRRPRCRPCCRPSRSRALPRRPPRTPGPPGRTAVARSQAAHRGRCRGWPPATRARSRDRRRGPGARRRERTWPESSRAT